jgi:hypothetical protein
MPGEGGGQGARLLPRHCGIAAGREPAGGASITVIDGLLAATTLEHNLTIVTCNSRDFAVPGLISFDPWGILKHEQTNIRQYYREGEFPLLNETDNRHGCWPGRGHARPYDFQSHRIQR